MCGAVGQEGEEIALGLGQRARGPRGNAALQALIVLAGGVCHPLVPPRRAVQVGSSRSRARKVTHFRNGDDKTIITLIW